MTQQVKLKIEGMTCGSCSRGITARLSKFDFVSNVNIDHETGTGVLDIADPMDDRQDKIIQAITQLGYQAESA